jgi:hypothetical protein
VQFTSRRYVKDVGQGFEYTGMPTPKPSFTSGSLP